MTRQWVGEIRDRYVKTVLVTAPTRKEAETKLRTELQACEELDVEHVRAGPGRIVGEAKKPGV